MVGRHSVLGIFVLGLMTLTSAHGAEDTVHLHEPSGSYFELLDFAWTRKNEISWDKAAEKAGRENYRGRRGQLAIVDTVDKHQFIRRHFDFRRPAWIGLRYWCSFRKMMWVDGSVHTHQAYQPWTTPWHRTGIRCGRNKIPWMPVYYTKDERWQAAGYRKAFRSMIVEYPAKAVPREAKK